MRAGDLAAHGLAALPAGATSRAPGVEVRAAAVEGRPPVVSRSGVRLASGARRAVGELRQRLVRVAQRRPRSAPVGAPR